MRLPSTDEQVDAAIEAAGVDLLTLRDVSGVDLPALGWRQIVTKGASPALCVRLVEVDG